MLVQSESHPIHPQHLECPRCGKHTVVLHGESHLLCINCAWHRDMDQTWEFSLLPPIGIILLILILL